MIVRCLVLIVLSLNAAFAQTAAPCACTEGQICVPIQGVSRCFDRTVCPAQCQDSNCIIQYTETGGIQTSCNCGAGTWDPITQRCKNGCPVCGANQFCSIDQRSGQSSCQCLDGFQYDVLTGECTNDGIFLPCQTRVNPCVNPNQECVNSQCQCKPGYTWDFVTRQCKQEIVNVGDRAWCASLGDPHYTTFDSVYYDYQGYCDHVFVRTQTFEIHSRNGNCFGTGWSGVTCTIGAAGRVGSVTFEFTQDRVIANGAVVPVFPTTIGPVTFGNSGGFTASFDGVIVSFSGFSLRVEVPDTYANGTSGLCGVFNYNPADDYTMRNGFVNSDSQAFASDWKVIAGADPILFYTQCPQAGNSTNGGNCWDQTYLLEQFRKCQDIITTTGNCNSYTDLSQAFKACVVDLCNIPLGDPNFPQISQTIIRDYIRRIYEGCDTEAPCARCNPTEFCDENKRCVCPFGTTRDPASNKCVRNGGVDGTCQTNNNCPPHQHCVLVGTNIGKCQCDDGYVFNFTTSQCDPAINTTPTTVICTGSGDPHYTTADGLYYDFQGRCDFVLWRGNGLEIQVRNSECNPTNPRPSVSCTEGVAFLAGTAVIRFDMTGAYVNNNPITTFPSTINGVIIENGNGFKATFANGAVITFMNWWVSVSVPSSFKTKMNGLCGYYDDVQSNDPKARDGVVRPIPDFAASWRVDSAVDPILFPQQACNTSSNGTGPIDGLNCDQNDADRRAAMDHCQRLLDVAADCQNFEDVSTAYISCIRDFCALATHSVTIDVVTTQIEVYRARCAIKQGDNDSYCGVCPDNSGCITDATGAKRCVCNSGFILNPTTGRCDPRDNTPAQPCDPTAANPCRENEYCEGNLNTPICKCIDGYYFNPSTRVCTPIDNPPPSNRVVCMSSGDPHYSTFDGSYYDYMGTCDHVLTQGNGLIVHTRNGDCSPYSIPPTISCTRGVAFKLGNDIIEFGADGLWINNVVSVAPQNVNGIIVVQTSGGYTATLPDTSVISYSTLSVSVSLPRASYINKMRGLCGFFDGTATNDYTSRGGALLPVYPFATSWLVSAAAGDPLLFHDNACVHTGNNESTPIDCTGPIHDRAVEICKGLLNIDDRCAQVIGLDVIIRNCIFDICAGFPVNVEEILRLVKERCGDNATDPCANCGPNEECVTVTLTDGRTVKSCRCKEGFIQDPTTKQCVDNIPAAPCKGGRVGPPCPPNMICREGICVCDRGFVTDDAGSCVPQTQYNNTWADCVIMGDPHYDTFDGVFYDYQNPCDTVLVYSPVNNFYVHGRNGQCWRQWPNTQVSCLMGIAFNQPGTSNKIELFPEGVYVNGVLQVLSSFPLTLGSGATALTIVMTNSFPGVDNNPVYSWNATFVDGTSVLYNSYFNGQVTVPSKFLRKTTGMCGTWNFTTVEDFTKRDGSLAANSVDFGDDWKVQQSDIQLFSTPNADCTNARSIGTPRQVAGSFDCNVQQYLDIAYESCRRLFNVARCRNVVDVTPYFRACVADYCAISETGEIFTNTSLLSYLNRCNSITRTSNAGGTSTGTNTQGTSTGSNTNTGTPTSTSGTSASEQSSSLAPVVQFSVALLAIVLAVL